MGMGETGKGWGGRTERWGRNVEHRMPDLETRIAENVGKIFSWKR